MCSDSITRKSTGTCVRHKLPRPRAWLPRNLFPWVLAVSVFTGAAWAEDIFDNPLAPPDTSSPRGTLQSFIENVRDAYDVLMPAYASYLAEPGLFPQERARKEAAVAEESLDRAVRTLDLSEVPPAFRKEVGLERALLLKEVLDRIPMPPLETIPGASAWGKGEAAKIDAAPDSGDADQDAGQGEGEVEVLTEVRRWVLPDTEIAIARIEEGPRKGEYLFTPATVERVEEFYEQVRSLPYHQGATEGFYKFIISSPGLLPPRWFEWIKSLPDWVKIKILGQALWQWAGLLLALFAASLLPLGVGYWRRHTAGRALGRTWRRFLMPVSLILVAYGVLAFVEGPLNITGDLLQLAQKWIEVFLFVAGSWAVVSFSGVIAEIAISSPRISERGLDASLLRIGFRILGLVIAVLIILEGLTRIGVPIVPLAAGLGVGGLAVALAAQPTLENLIASFTLYLDRPLKVGDFCRYGEDAAGFWRIGAVEEIGLRSTRLRGIDRTVTTIPNSDFAKLQLTNLTQRDRMLLKVNIGLRYETTPEQLRFVLTKLREMLLAHPKVTEDPARVRFMGFGNSSLNVEIFSYGDTKDWNEFLAIQEDVYLRIMDIVDEAGTGFAFPSQTTYFRRDSGLSKEQGEAAEAEVQAWRESGNLPFPEFAREHRERVWNTLRYPPEGSPVDTVSVGPPAPQSRQRTGFKWKRDKP